MALVDPRTGIIRSVDFVDLYPDDPAVFVAVSHAADSRLALGQLALNDGAGASVNATRACNKAIGESVERYCGAHCDPALLRFATFDELAEEAVPPEAFALFSVEQYGRPDFPFPLPSRQTKLAWRQGLSLSTTRPTWVPASFVYVPYAPRFVDEVVLDDSISTGLAAGPSSTFATYRAILEVIERDAFMTTWLGTLRPTNINVVEVRDDLPRRLLDAVAESDLRCYACLLPSELPASVVLVLLESPHGYRPYKAVGLGADLEPAAALASALEEAILTFVAVRKSVAEDDHYEAVPGYMNVTSLAEHARAHALDERLLESTRFLKSRVQTVSLDRLEKTSTGTLTEKTSYLVDELSALGYEAIRFDLTTPDVDDAGFKVVRVVVPGLQPLDLSMTRRHCGGSRIRSGGLNPVPHPFP